MLNLASYINTGQVPVRIITNPIVGPPPVRHQSNNHFVDSKLIRNYENYICPLYEYEYVGTRMSYRKIILEFFALLILENFKRRILHIYI